MLPTYWPDFLSAMSSAAPAYFARISWKLARLAGASRPLEQDLAGADLGGAGPEVTHWLC